MPELLDRARTRLSAGAPTGGAADGPRRLPVAAVLAAGWAVAAGVALCVGVALVGWLAGSAGSSADAVRVGVQAWLLGLGSGLQAGSTSVTAAPLGLTAVSGYVVWRSAAWAAATSRVDDLRSALSAAAIVAAGFAAAATVAALLTTTDASAVPPVRAFAFALLLAGAAAGLGVLRGAGLLTAGWLQVPEPARPVLRGSASGALGMFAAGALAVSVGLVADFDAAANIAHAADAGVVGGAILTAAGVLALPNAALLGVAYLLGPGFAFGAGTSVAPSGVVLGRVPAFPLLAALPDEGPASWWTAGVLAAPVLAGVLAASVAWRHGAVARLDRAMLRGGVAGLLGGVATGAATGLAGGSVGPGRLGEVGALVAACTASAAVTMALAGALTGLVLCWRARRRAG